MNYLTFMTGFKHVKSCVYKIKYIFPSHIANICIVSQFMRYIIQFQPSRVLFSRIYVDWIFTVCKAIDNICKSFLYLDKILYIRDETYNYHPLNLASTTIN